ncbi:MAG TPA: PAS domain S-box protein [Fimbriimonadaceae bacterium]
MMLSEREEQVLLLSTKGLTDKEIAKKLKLSIATVNTYWVRIRTKLGGTNRAELVAAALNKNAEETLTAKESENQRLISEVVRRADAERALRESQSRLQSIIDGTPVVVFIKDLQGRYTLVNKEFESVIGKERKEVLGKRDYDVFGQEIGELYRAQDQKVIETGENVESEVTINGPEGKRHFMSVKFGLVNTEGTLYAICGFAGEITSRMEIEKKLEQERQRYVDLFEHAPDGYVVTDLQGKILEANRAAIDLFGCSVADCVGVSIDEFVVQDLKQSFTSGFSSLDEQDTIHEWELKIRPAGRPVFDASLSVKAVRDGKGSATAYRWLIRDVTSRKFAEHELKSLNEALERRVRTRTIELEESNLRLTEEIAERKRAEEDLLSSHQFAHNVMECSLDGILGFDSRFRITLWNRRLEEMYGVNREDALGGNAFELFPFLKDLGEKEFFEKALRGEHAISHNRPYHVEGNGKTGFFDAHYSPIRNDKNEIIGGMAVIREVNPVRDAHVEMR